VPNRRRAARGGVARRNAKLTALRELVSPERAILAVDLAPGSRPRSRVITTRWCRGRRVFTGPASCIAQIVAGPAAAGAGFAGLVLACELARHQWEPLAVAARAEASL
jgi:transposase